MIYLYWTFGQNNEVSSSPRSFPTDQSHWMTWHHDDITMTWHLLLTSQCRQTSPLTLSVPHAHSDYLGVGTALHCPALHCTVLNYTALHCNVLNYTAPHCTALHGRAVWDTVDTVLQWAVWQFWSVDAVEAVMSSVEAGHWTAPSWTGQRVAVNLSADPRVYKDAPRELAVTSPPRAGPTTRHEG